MTIIRNPAAAPDRDAALAQYTRRACVYDLELAAFEPVRRRAIARLGLTRGDTVLDVGCGTGLSFALLQQQVGPGGAIIGIEQCPDMMERARQQVLRHGWSNVTLLCSPVELAEIPVVADAALFHFTHDILRRSDALENVDRHLRPGAHLVASGLRWASPWAWPVNMFVLSAALHSVTSLGGLGQPWDKLVAFSNGFEVEGMLAGGVYVASGVRAGRPATEERRATPKARGRRVRAA